METVIYKYQLPVEVYFSLEIPKGSIFLHGEVVDGVPTIWLRVDPEEEKVATTMRLVHTGKRITYGPNWVYKKTFVLYGGDLVTHLFIKIDGGILL